MNGTNFQLKQSLHSVQIVRSHWKFLKVLMRQKFKNAAILTPSAARVANVPHVSLITPSFRPLEFSGTTPASVHGPMTQCRGTSHRNWTILWRFSYIWIYAFDSVELLPRTLLIPCILFSRTPDPFWADSLSYVAKLEKQVTIPHFLSQSQVS